MVQGRRELSAVLVAVGALAVVDNVVFHWLLGWHQLIEGWPYNAYAEAALVLLGVTMFMTGVLGLRSGRH